MIDEQTLEQELTRLAESFPVPADGPAMILARRDQGKATRPSRVGRLKWFYPSVLLPVAGLAALIAVIAVFGPSRQTSEKFAKAGSAIDGGAGRVSPQPATSFASNQPFHAPSGTISSSAAAGSGGLAATTGAPAPAPVDSAKVVKTGEIGLVVPRDRFSATLGQLTTLANGAGGYVASSSTTEDASSPSGHLTLRVPVASFEDVVAKVRRLGQVTTVSSSGRDVTGESVDLDARLSSLSAARQQYITLMSKATSVGDVLAVQQQINDLQTQIEQLKGQKQVLDSQSSMSTLDVSVGDRKTVTSPRSPSGLSRAWHRATHGFVGAIEGLVGASGIILFLLLAGVAIWLLGRPLWRRMRLWAL